MIQNAKWIWHQGKYNVNEYADFITDIEIDAADKDAAFYISVDTEYALWIYAK